MCFVILVYVYKKADWDHLKSLLQRVNFDCSHWDSDINYNWLSWKDLLFATIDARKSSHAPWITKELIVMCRKKRLLYKKAKQINKESVWLKYRELNNLLKPIYNFRIIN